MCAPALHVSLLEPSQDVAKPRLEVREGRDRVGVREHRITEGSPDDLMPNEVDQRISLCIDVVFVQEHFRELQYFAQPPSQRGHRMGERLVRAQRVERIAIGGVGREILHPLERSSRARRDGRIAPDPPDRRWPAPDPENTGRPL